MEGFSEKGEPREWDMAVGEVYGYRWWKLQVPAFLAGYADYSAAKFDLREAPLIGANACGWFPGKREAVCTRYNPGTPSWEDLLEDRQPWVHEPPEIREACGCGFWAYFDKALNVDTVIGGFTGAQASVSGDNVWLPIFGVIRGTGRVIIGTKGFRSQYAEILGLCVSDRAKEHLRWNVKTELVRRRSPDWALSQAMLGDSSHDEYDSMQVTRQAPDEERLRRVATVEAMLSVAYPGARVFCDQEALCKYFPPDANYAPKIHPGGVNF